MNLSSSGVADLIFKQVVHKQEVQGNFGKLSLDGKMLSVLMNLDGNRTLSQVAQELGLTLKTVRPIIVKLIKFKLVERVESTANAADKEFMSFLLSQLSLAIGPLGSIIIEDGLEDLGFTEANFPISRIAELVNLLSQEIPREDKRILFKQAMLKKIQEKGY